LSTVRPPRQVRTGTTLTGARKAGSKTPRSRSREFALQALYQVQVFTRELAGFHKADPDHYMALLEGCAQHSAALDVLITPLLDRRMLEISPVEHAIMWIGAYELQHCVDVPWRVAINECVELAKEFGGTDGHKYINAVLNGLAAQLRPQEVKADRDAGLARG
jgi:N utilization substance protein B